MLIQSSFRDYYDVGQRMGVDKSLVYRRRAQVHTSPKAILILANLCARVEGMEPFWLWNADTSADSIDQVPAILGFCGKAYAFFQFVDSYWYALNRIDRIVDPNVVGAFTLEGVVEKVEQTIRRAATNSQKAINEFHREFAEPSYYKGYKVRKPSKKDRIAGMIQEVDNVSIPHQVFHSLGVPIFLLNKVRLITNPCLIDTDFHKVVPHIQAFQEIAMYLGGVLGQRDEAPITVGDDETIARQKGFDDQSFRQISPGLKKLRRAENKLKERQDKSNNEK